MKTNENNQPKSTAQLIKEARELHARMDAYLAKSRKAMIEEDRKNGVTNDYGTLPAQGTQRRRREFV